MDFLQELDQFVMGAIKRASNEPGSSLPSVGDGNVPAPEGARAKENTSDVKAEVGTASVDTAEAVEETTGGVNTPSNSIGTEAAATGEAPAVETASAGSKPSDPGTSHPAKATMGEKYSAAQLVTMGDEILASIAVAAEKSATAAVKAPVKKAEAIEVEIEKAKDGEKPEVKVETEAEEKAEEKAEEAGKDAAAAVIDEAQKLGNAEQLIASVVKAAALDAQNTADYLLGYTEKLAESMPMEQSGAEVPPEAAAAMEDPAAMAPEAGGEPEANGDDELEAVVDALVEAGVSPEELMALASEGQAGAGAEMAPEAMPAGVADEAAKVASARAEANKNVKRAAMVQAIRLAASQKQKGG